MTLNRKGKKSQDTDSDKLTRGRSPKRSRNLLKNIKGKFSKKPTVQGASSSLLKKFGPKISPYQNPRIAVAAVVLRSVPSTKSTVGLEMLLVQRWVYPYKGAWAFPGDFIGHNDPKEEVIRILEYTTNLTGTAHFLTILGSNERDPRDHVVTFVFLVLVSPESLISNDEQIIIMSEDGSLGNKIVKRSPIDRRPTPSWAWWYDVSQLPDWLDSTERAEFEKLNPELKEYELVDVAFDYRTVFPLAKEWIEKNGEEKCVVVDPNPEPQQPLNQGNSALTGDIIVIKQRKDNRKFEIALIVRGANPFKGKNAFPGGFINYKEDPAVGAVRELTEETNLTGNPKNVHLLEYKGSLERDPRQHTVTCVYVVKADSKSLKNLKYGDDAADVQWYDLDDVFSWPDFGGEGAGLEFDPTTVPLEERRLAFDHAVILQDFRKWWEHEGKKNKWYVDEAVIR